MDLERLKGNFTPEEVEIIGEYLDGKSIRQISEVHRGFGRTKIRNIIERCITGYPSFKEELEKKIFQNKYHKKEDNETLKLPDLSEEQIAQAYEDIKGGKTLTQVAKSLGRTRDFIKSNIIDYINDDEEVKEFLAILKLNRHPQRKDKFLELSEEEKKKILFAKLNQRRALNNRREYSETYLNRKYERLKKYFLETRNQRIEDEDKITEKDFFNMLFDRPTLLSSSLQNRIIPAIENLENHPDIGVRNTNRILREDTSVLGSSISKTNLQIKILKDNGLLETCFEKPRNFRTSPELLYSLIEFAKSRNLNGRNVFITKTKLKTDYSVTPDELKKTHNVKQKYGDDEYFER